MKFRQMIFAAAAVAGLTLSAGVQAHDLGFAGLLSKGNKAEMPKLTLASGKPVSAEGAITLESGRYYEMEIIGDGSAELALSGSGFFRAIWVDEVVVNDLEIRPIGIDSIEFDDSGEMEIGFIAIKPGTYRLAIPGSTGETQGVTITIK